MRNFSYSGITTYITCPKIDILKINNDIKEVEIIDYKSGKLQSQKDVHIDLQLSIYHIAAEELFQLKVNCLSLYFLKDNIKIETKRTDQDIIDTKELLSEIVERIQNKEFYATPTTSKCQYCDYRNSCKYTIK